MSVKKNDREDSIDPIVLDRHAKYLFRARGGGEKVSTTVHYGSTTRGARWMVELRRYCYPLFSTGDGEKLLEMALGEVRTVVCVLFVADRLSGLDDSTKREGEEEE